MQPSRPTIDPVSTHDGSFEAPEVIEVDSHRVWCDGGEGGLGHPRVYLEMGAAHFVECPYCDRRYVLSHHPVIEQEEPDPAAYDGAAGR